MFQRLRDRETYDWTGPTDHAGKLSSKVPNHPVLCRGQETDTLFSVYGWTMVGGFTTVILWVREKEKREALVLELMQVLLVPRSASRASPELWKQLNMEGYYAISVPGLDMMGCLSGLSFTFYVSQSRPTGDTASSVSDLDLTIKLCWPNPAECDTT